LVFEDCRVHKSQVLGEVGNGWALNQAWLGARRFQVGIHAHGMAQRVLRAVANGLRQDAHEAEKYLGAIGYFLGEIEALKTLTYTAAWRADQKMDVRLDAAKVKLFGTELAHKVIDSPSRRPAAMRKDVIARRFTRARPAHRRRAVRSAAPHHSARAIPRRRRAAGIAIGCSITV
jgi:acyl-CoA dehydrogenase